jgi:hypothetical protein
MDDAGVESHVRMHRRQLKESGDWLGVQGANPDTGEFDNLTPTTSSGSEATALRREATVIKRPRRVVWRRGDNQWSSVAEPDLSPIAQSQNSSAHGIGEYSQCLE